MLLDTVITNSFASDFDYKIEETKPFNRDFVVEVWSKYNSFSMLLDDYGKQYEKAYNSWEKKQGTIEVLFQNIDKEPNAELLKKAFDINWAYYYWLQHIKGFIIGFPKMSKKIFDDMKWDAFKKLCTAKMKKGEIYRPSFKYRFTYERQQEFHNHLKKYNIYSDDICDYPDWR